MVVHKIRRLKDSDLLPQPGPTNSILFVNESGTLQILNREDGGIPSDVDSGGSGSSGDTLNVQTSGYAGANGDAWVEYTSTEIILKVKIGGTEYDLATIDR